MPEEKKIQTPDRVYSLEGHLFSPGDKLGGDGLKMFKKYKANTVDWKAPKKKESK